MQVEPVFLHDGSPVARDSAGALENDISALKVRRICMETPERALCFLRQHVVHAWLSSLAMLMVTWRGACRTLCMAETSDAAVCEYPTESSASPNGRRR